MTAAGQPVDWAGLERLLAERRWVGDVVTELAGGVRARARRDHTLHCIPGGEGLLETAGPVYGRDIDLVGLAPPERVLAVCTELVVPARLPAEVAVALAAADEPLPWLLDAAGVDWHGQLAREPDPDHRRASGSPPAPPVLHRLLRLWIGESQTCALISECVYVDALPARRRPADLPGRPPQGQTC